MTSYIQDSAISVRPAAPDDYLQAYYS